MSLGHVNSLILYKMPSVSSFSEMCYQKLTKIQYLLLAFDKNILFINVRINLHDSRNNACLKCEKKECVFDI